MGHIAGLTSSHSQQAAAAAAPAHSQDVGLRAALPTRVTSTEAWRLATALAQTQDFPVQLSL